MTIGGLTAINSVKCTKPTEAAPPPYCGKMPDGVDCYICKWSTRGFYRTPKSPQRSGLLGKRRNSGVGELFGKTENEQNAACSDVFAKVGKEKI